MSSFNTIRVIPQKVALDDALQVVPSSATDLSTVDTYIFGIQVANTTGADVTLLVKDKASTPKTLVPTVPIAGKSTSLLSFPEGVKMTDGVSWQAGAADSLHASILAFKTGLT